MKEKLQNCRKAGKESGRDSICIHRDERLLKRPTCCLFLDPKEEKLQLSRKRKTVRKGIRRWDLLLVDRRYIWPSVSCEKWQGGTIGYSLHFRNARYNLAIC